LSRICRRSSCFTSADEAIVVVVLWQGQSEEPGLAHRGRAHLRWSKRRSLGACACSRWPAVAALLPHLQAEWRPNLYLPAKTPKGRQYGFRPVAMVAGHGSFVPPSGIVPGGGEVQPVRKLRTRSRFFTLLRGPFCKVQGLVCNFLSFVCLDVICALVSILE
jgi:hypothetical protein